MSNIIYNFALSKLNNNKDMELSLEKIPKYMMPFFINGDTEGYTDEEINEAIEWL